MTERIKWPLRIICAVAAVGCARSAWLATALLWSLDPLAAFNIALVGGGVAVLFVAAAIIGEGP